MRLLHTSLLGQLISVPALGNLPLSIAGIPAGVSLPGQKGVDLPTVAAPLVNLPTATAFIVSSTSLSTTLQSSFLKASTITKTIDVSSFMTSPISVSTIISASSAAIASSNSVSSSAQMSSNTSAPSGDAISPSRRNLIIVLSAVLGFVGILLVLGIAFIFWRYCRGQIPFSHRGASPINDDEIASWRRTGHEQKLPIPPPSHGPAIREVSSIPLAHAPAWTWAASPTSIRTISANVSDSHAVLAKAPNARAGLTDEALPGADPFITPPKRQSSRLSKAPPGHARTKSRRSSISAKSMWSNRDRTSNDFKARDGAWYDHEDAAISSHLRSTEGGSSSPGTSIFDGLSSGGLSPRPKSRPRLEDIGRAIA